LEDRYWHPNWSNQGWLESARRTLVRKSVLDLPALTSQWAPEQRRLGQLSYASAIDNCLWERPGEGRQPARLSHLGSLPRQGESLRQFATPRHHRGTCQRGEAHQDAGIHGLQDSPSVAQRRPTITSWISRWPKAVRKAAGDDFTLLNDPVGVYTREEAIKVGRVLQDLAYVAYEDPVPTKDIEGLVQLNQALDIPIHVGEFIFSPYDFAEYIRRGAMDVVRFIVDNVGGITGGMRSPTWRSYSILECAPHNWGGPSDHAGPLPLRDGHAQQCVVRDDLCRQGSSDRPYIIDKFRVEKDGYVHASPSRAGAWNSTRAALDEDDRAH